MTPIFRNTESCLVGWVGRLLLLGGLVTALSGYVPAAEAAATAGSGPNPVINRIEVTINDFPGEKAYWAAVARELIVLQAGDRLLQEDVTGSIQALEQSRLFRTIHVDSKKAADGILIEFDLVPFRLIKDIKIEGAYPLFERDVLKVMTMFVGDTFSEEKLANQATAVQDLFVRSGFPDPKIDLAVHPDAQDGHVVVVVRIQKGPPEKLQGLTLHGNRAFSESRLKWKLATWRATALPGGMGRFVETAFKKDIENLIAFYRRAGFADMTIRSDIRRDPGAPGPVATITIVEGPRYDITFSGNKEFWDRTLQKDLVLFTEGNRNGFGLKKSIRKIKDRYRQAGYLATGIAIEKIPGQTETADMRKIRLSINEGPCTLVEKIQITGNRALTEKEIKKQMLTRTAGTFRKGAFVPEVLVEDLYAIRALYTRYGYLDATITKHERWRQDRQRVVVSIDVQEGVQTIVATTKITGLTALTVRRALEKIRLKHPEPFRAHMVQSDENALAALISEKGYPHVQVKGEGLVSADKTRADVTYTVDEGPFVTAGQVYYQGNFRTQKRLLDREFGMKTGAPFSLGKMLAGQRSVRNLGLFDSVKLRAIGLKEKKKKVDLIVEVEEKKPYFFELGGGYESQKGFFANSKAGDHNLFGSNKDGWIGAEISEIGYRAETRIREPQLWGSRILASAGVFAERREEFNKDFGTDTYGASVGFGRTLWKNLTAGLDTRFEKREQYTRTGAVPLSESDAYESRSIVVTTPALRYDNRDSFIRPTRGGLAQLAVDISSGLTSDLDDFLKYRADFRYFITPFSRLTFAGIARAGYIKPYGSFKTVPEDQLFFLGGTADVRGFDENLLSFDPQGNALGGRSQLSGSLEARIDLGWNFELAFFYDAGRISESLVENETTNTVRQSAGTGLRYITPIGPVGLLYGRKLDPLKGEGPDQFHFTIGYTF